MLAKNEMRYLIIGASGFLGQTVYYKLKGSGKEVWGTYSSRKIDHDLIVFSIVEVNELAEAVLELADNDYVGIINVSEEQPVNHYEFNLFLCGLNDWDSSWIKPYKEHENIYYLNNVLRKRVLNTRLRGDD